MFNIKKPYNFETNKLFIKILNLTLKRNLKFKLAEDLSNIIIGHTGYIGSFLLKEMIKNEEFLTETIVFNNLVKTKKEYINAWESLAIESWHKNLFI